VIDAARLEHVDQYAGAHTYPIAGHPPLRGAGK
jgi:hypothetical protein